MFLQRVAGPSRLPYRAVATVARRCNSSAPPTAAEPTGDELADRDSRTAFSREKAIWASNEGYKRWKSSSGNQYKAIPRGQKAAWLGGHVPYTSNPSFQPPPPISDKLQSVIYRDLKTRTVGQISEQLNISKARIEAVRKLKQVEEEFKRQGLQLQDAFQKGMEPLLGVKYYPDDNLISTSVESEEEQRYLKGLGAGGAFGDQSTPQDQEGIERTVWEYRDEGFKESAAEQAAAVRAAVKSGEKKVLKKHKEVTARPAKSVYRFVDTSS